MEAIMTDLITRSERRAGARDFESYRTSATALRRLAMRDGKTLRAIRAGVLTLAGVLGLIFLIATSPTPATRGFASVTSPGAAQMW
jgi:hypothetical protein